MKILVVGYDTRHVVSSGWRAGYEMYAIDAFCDVDLRRFSKGFLKFQEKPNEKDLLRIIKSFSVKFDAVVLNSGFERYRIPLKCLNDPEETRLLFTDKFKSNLVMESLGIPVPKVWENQPECEALLKPRYGGGGSGIRIVHPHDDIESSDNYFFQEITRGKPISVSFISDGSDFVIASINEILVGERKLNQKNPFGYCGNVTPFLKADVDEIKRICEILVDNFCFFGSNGIDLIVNEKGIFVLEVNPRFQGSLDTIELSTEENLFEHHVRAFEGDLREFRNRRFASKGIYFADKTSIVCGDLFHPFIADIPEVGEIIEEGRPVATALGVGRSREEAISMMWRKVGKIKESLKSL
jgi:hypothetical protein